jgi:hypothetical protein
VFGSTRYLLTAALGLGLVGALTGQEPGRLGVDAGQAVKPRPGVPSNQQLADSIAQHLRQSAHLQGLHLDIVADKGVVELAGQVIVPMQRDEALRIVQGVPGVERVRDKMTVQYPNPMPVMQTQAAMPPVNNAAPLPQPPPAVPGNPTPYTVPAEPFPVMPVGFQSPYALNTPMMPPYAWPTYAPYSNYSRVGYPDAYPYNAWPFIGPVYPFPKVPLGWRKVQLEWQDGHWWFGKIATCYDWWRLRYW